MTVANSTTATFAYACKCQCLTHQEGKSFTVTYITYHYTYSFQLQCVENPLLRYYVHVRRAGLNATIEYLHTIRYPTTAHGYFIGNMIGGGAVNRRYRYLESEKRTKKCGKIAFADARAIRLPYMLMHGGSHDGAAAAWERAFTRLMTEYKDPRATVTWWTSETLSDESARDRDKLLKLLV